MGLIALLLFIQNRYFPRVEHISTIDTVWVDVLRDTVIEKPVPYYVNVPVYDTVYTNDTTYLTDSNCIALYKNLWVEHNTERWYRDTLWVDYGYIHTNYKVVRNEPKDFFLGASLSYPEITITKYDTRPFLSGGFIVGRDRFMPVFGIGIQNIHLEVGYDGDMYVGGRYLRRFNAPRFRYLSR